MSSWGESSLFQLGLPEAEVLGPPHPSDSRWFETSKGFDCPARCPALIKETLSFLQDSQWAGMELSVSTSQVWPWKALAMGTGQ